MGENMSQKTSVMDSADSLEDKEGVPGVAAAFPTAVATRIEELMGGTDHFDSADFDAVAYINSVFPTEQALAGVEAAEARAHAHLAQVQAEVGALVRAQPRQRAAGQRALQHAASDIRTLHAQVSEITVRAAQGERAVREITGEIRRLDLAKAHLTAAVTALHHYHMLAGGVATLQQLAANRQYRELRPTLQALMEVLQHLASYRAIPGLSALRDKVHEARASLAAQVLTDARAALGGGGGGMGTLSDACALLDVLDARHKGELVRWLVAQQLQEYEALFSPEQECARLDSVSRRFAWLKQRLLAFERAPGPALPPHWPLSQLIAARFCQLTRDQLSHELTARRGEGTLDARLLLHAVQKTRDFEVLLHKRFQGTDLELDSAPPYPAEVPDFDKDLSERWFTGEEECGGVSVWLGLISRCFEPHLAVYVASLDASLRQLFDQLLQDSKSHSAESGAASGAASAGSGAVLASCADLFLFYKKCLAQCARLSTGQPMLELCAVFAKYLREYCGAVLQPRLPRAGATSSVGLPGLSALLSNDAAARFTRAEVTRIASVITTAEYCLETTVHLEQRLRQKVALGLAERVDLGPEQDLFHKLITHCIQMLVQDLELACEPALQAMAKISWLHFDTVGDQSSYVTQIVMHLRNTVPYLRDNLDSSRKYFTQFCIRFANSFIPKFIQNVYKCKPISTVGSEQLLLDTHMLKTALLDLPSIGLETKRPAPATYTKVVIKLMTKAEMVLKLVMAPLDGMVEGFVSQFVQLLPECTLAEFHKVLDMKGAKLSKAQLTALDALFKETAKSVSSDVSK